MKITLTPAELTTIVAEYLSIAADKITVAVETPAQSSADNVSPQESNRYKRHALHDLWKKVNSAYRRNDPDRFRTLVDACQMVLNVYPTAPLLDRKAALEGRWMDVNDYVLRYDTIKGYASYADRK